MNTKTILHPSECEVYTSSDNYKQLQALRAKNNYIPADTLPDYVTEPPVIPQWLESCVSETESLEDLVFKIPSVEKETYHISEVINSENIITNRLRIVIHALLGSGKSTWLKELQSAYPDEKFAYVFIYKNDLLDQFNNRLTKYRREEYILINGHAPEEDGQITKEINASAKEKSSTTVVRSNKYVPYVRNKMVMVYTNILFEIFLSIQTEEDFPLSLNRVDNPQMIIDSYISDRIVVSDEADFLSNIIYAVAKAQRNGLETDINEDILFAAAKDFYEYVNKKAKAVILLTATLQQRWLNILPSNFAVVESPYPLKSINLRSVKLVPMVEWERQENTLTANIVYNEMNIKPYNKVLLYAPSINLTVLKNLSGIRKKRIAVVANQEKITSKAFAYINSHRNVTLIPFASGTDSDLDSKLTDELVMTHDYIFITNSNCRGVSLVRPYGDVLVVTIAPVGSEVIHAAGRFRPPRNEFINENTPQTTTIDLCIIDRLKKHNHSLADFRESQEEMRRKYLFSETVTNFECYDIEFTIDGSNLVEVDNKIDKQYVSSGYKFLQKEMPTEIKINKKSADTIAKNNAIKESLLTYPSKGSTFHQKNILEKYGIKVAPLTIRVHKEKMARGEI
jgi:hypothetical protein